MAATAGVGPLVKEWRGRRRRSQLDLALEAGVSARHLSFVETGRSRPSPELVLTLADHLDVPLRERNTLLLAAGYAPRYQETPLDDPTMDQVRASLTRLLDAHDPYPGVVIDARWDVVLANHAAGLLTALLPPSLTEGSVNVFRACLHPDGLARLTRNLDAWATYLVGQLHRMVVTSRDPDLAALEQEVLAYPNLAFLHDAAAGDDHDLLVPVELEVDGRTLSLFTTLTSFGTPRDITLAELAVELFYPADAATEAALRARGGAVARSAEG